MISDSKLLEDMLDERLSGVTQSSGTEATEEVERLYGRNEET